MITEILFFLALSVQPDDDTIRLFERIRTGDKKAFKEFYDKNQSALFSFLLSKGLDRGTAEDLIQQAFLIIWEKRKQIDPKKSLRSYLFTTAYNRMLNHFRDRKDTEPEYAYELPSEGVNPEEKAIQSEAIRQMHTVLSEMPERRRSVFEFCYLQGFTHKETAEAMEVSVKTVENHMALALKDLRKALKNFS
ncbi:RNA polymerase sigma factor [Rhodohalobacter mucosus]|uniref:RNA polymerase sigma-70 factor n=1 Tax=Rhodohalobacter mucosus TaxID=2079485 RepID=A0A316TYA3_9BACT|nr:RNA polymerase sigma-70 factor [Rhodohalobacter mucosus]PWN07704.1 RNA polymerase sigma-70 factor [Rhodohalobacter mucosus]